MFDSTSLLGPLVFAYPIISRFWWFWLFLILSVFSYTVWLAYVRECYKRRFNWVLLELRVPREVRKTPQAMEQVFMTMHALANGPSNFKEKYWDGEITMWFSCEIVSLGGEIRFYVRVPGRHRNVVEASLYAHYSDIEIAEVTDDYLNHLPETVDELKKNNYELFGNEFRLEKEDVYPIRTYVDFETPEEEERLDPIGALLEILTKIKPEEKVFLQILVRPADDAWKEKGEKLAKELKERGKEYVTSQFGAHPVYPQLTPGEIEVLKTIQRNVAKPGFDTIIRQLYIAPKETFDHGFPRRGVISAFNQYASETLNRFKNNVFVWTLVSPFNPPYVFTKTRALGRQRRIYRNYRRIVMHPEGGITFGLGSWKSYRMVLNAEELATIFHLPTIAVLTGPLIKRAEAKKIGPPAGLAIFGQGEDILPGIK